jgi:hypothetical protein
MEDGRTQSVFWQSVRRLINGAKSRGCETTKVSIVSSGVLYRYRNTTAQRLQCWHEIDQVWILIELNHKNREYNTKVGVYGAKRINERGCDGGKCF